MFYFKPTRTFKNVTSALIIAVIFAFGFTFFPIRNSIPSLAFWSIWTAITFGWVLIVPGRALVARWRLHARIRAILPPASTGTASEISGLAAAAVAIKRGEAERALYLLQNMTLKTSGGDVEIMHRCLSSLASVCWMMRQKPGRPLSPLRYGFPQLQALVFSYGAMRVALSEKSLQRELSEARSVDLDALAQDYIRLIDLLLESLGNREMPFAEEAEEVLAFMTGQAFMLNAHDRFAAWWQERQPMIVRGGGAFIVALRLSQRECYGEAAEMLKRLSNEGMLSFEADTLRRVCSFLSLFAQPQWRMTSADIPRYFTEGYYYLAIEMGVLRYPTAELAEVVNCCQRGKILRDSKKSLMDDVLKLWEATGDDLSGPLSLLFKRLLEYKGRHNPARFSYWREQWEIRRPTFERAMGLVMDGIAATHARRLNDACRLFEEVARLEPQWNLPLVNLVHVHLLRGNTDEARALCAVIQAEFPKDGHAFISLGRLLALQTEDSTEAEKLFIKAHELTDPPTEALICLGEIKLMDGLYMEAQAYFDHARQLDPSLPDPKLGLARVYLETRRFTHAIENLNAVVLDGPDEARCLAHYLLYRTYREMGHDRRAFECLDKVPQKFFKEPDMLDDIAGHLESEHQYAKAREFAERAMILRASGQARSDDPDALGAF